MTAERTKDFDVLTADGHAIAVECLGMSPVDACAWVRDEAAAAVRAEYAADGDVRGQAEGWRKVCALLDEVFPERDRTGRGIDSVLLAISILAERAKSPPLSSSPVARAEMTEEVIENIARNYVLPHSTRSVDGGTWYLTLDDRKALVRAGASLSSPDAAARVEEVIEFVRAWRGFEVDVAGQHGPSTGNALLRDLRAKFLPAPPAAPRSVRLVCGDVVEPPKNGGDLWRRDHLDGKRIGHSYNPDPVKLLYDTDTLGDKKAVESLASTLGGVR